MFTFLVDNVHFFTKGSAYNNININNGPYSQEKTWERCEKSLYCALQSSAVSVFAELSHHAVIQQPTPNSGMCSLTLPVFDIFKASTFQIQQICDKLQHEKRWKGIMV